MENKNKLRTMILTLVIGILVFFQLGNYTVDASAVEASIISMNVFEWSPIIWGVVIIGGSIGITLSYVSWRKYKGEQQSKEKRDKMID